MINSNEQLTPREHMLMENEKEENQKAREHALAISKMALEKSKTEIKLKQMDATRSRLHQQKMKETELAIIRENTKWQNLLRIPIFIILLPVYVILAIGSTIQIARTGDLPDKIYKLIK